MELQPGEHVWSGVVPLRFQVLGVNPTELLRLGDADNPRYIGVQAPDDKGHACGQP